MTHTPDAARTQDAQDLDWLEVITATDEQRAGMAARLHLATTEGGGCYMISIDGRWLSGQRNAVIFDSSAAAERFLSMVGVARPDGLVAVDEPLHAHCREARQCFHLSPYGGLGACPNKNQTPWYATPEGAQPASVRGGRNGSCVRDFPGEVTATS